LYGWYVNLYYLAPNPRIKQKGTGYTLYHTIYTNDLTTMALNFYIYI